MNKKRREEIKTSIAMLELVKSDLEKVLAEEEEAFDNMQNFQNSVKGMDSENAIDILNEAVDSVENCIDILNEI